jgi:threonyl-tRNA synthetase
MAFWHPKGQLIWRMLEGVMRELQGTSQLPRGLDADRGQREALAPVGHWELYKENMFIVQGDDRPAVLAQADELPGVDLHLPLEAAARTATSRSATASSGGCTGTSAQGSLSGLTRVRQFIQDDAHIYVRPDQLMDEIRALLGEVHEAYSWFGLKPRFSFATKPDKAIGDPALWEKAERLTMEAFAASDISYVLKPKDGTFYAPKIDIYIDDALGREWQMATIQIDLTMLPEQFDLTYDDENGEQVRPMAIHRAIYGSLERFIGILIEHFRRRVPAVDRAGAGRDHPDRGPPHRGGRGARRVLRAARPAGRGGRSDNRMQNKIRLAQEQKVPYMLVLGDREIEASSATVRPRRREGGRPGDVPGTRCGPPRRGRRPGRLTDRD